MIEVIIENWDKVAMGFAGVLAFFGGRKSKKSKEKTEAAGALSSMQSTYNEFVIDQKEFVMGQRRQNAETNLEFYKVKEELRAVKNDSQKLKEEVKGWRSKYNALKKQFETYKSNHP